MSSVGRKSGTAPATFKVKANAAVPYFHAFFNVGDGTIQSSVYDSAGGFVSDRGSPLTAAYPSGSFPYSILCYIRTDSGGFVGDGSVAYWNDDGTITVVDPVNSTVSTFSALASTYVGAGVGFADGWLYWMEASPLTSGHTVVRLRKCRTDGSSVTTVSTTNYVPNTVTGTPTAHWVDFTGFAISADAVMASGEWQRQDGQDAEDMIFPLDGSSPTFSERIGGGAALGRQYSGVAYPSGTFGLKDALEPRIAGDAADPSWSQAWASVSWSAVNVDAGAAHALAYGSSTNGVVVGAFATLGAGAPSLIIAAADVAYHPTIAGPPQALFLIA